MRQRVHGGPSDRPDLNQAAVPQARQMLGDGGLGKAKMRGQVYDAMLSKREVPKDAEPRGVSEPTEEACGNRESSGAVLIGHNLCHRHIPMLAQTGNVVKASRDGMPTHA
ncbi:hypothetical protein GCM10011376_29920 [Nocardioides flavus (ex Wang et al. 2016)]|uniref:Uncharacterized protein n=1 Tax=Nocardioides flavus (ex Wang et al. 2016) TaxID=2058780 RepID=A0ABQ3HNY8_9ACTN|nr:hypothetical protein GCM10011376_29920 [Nocardioides flavus (ex Wang et al. 2016)]